MPYIIAATDFSAIAKNAIHYACKLAIYHNAEIIAFHSLLVPVSFSEVPIPIIAIDEVGNAAEENMDSLVSELKQDYPGLIVTGKVVYGDIIDSLEDFAGNESQPLMAVIGNSNTGENTYWLDSKMIEAFRHLKYPILAIPPEAVFRQVNKICFAYDNIYKGSELALQQLSVITGMFHAELHIINTQEDVMTRDNLSDIDANTIKQLQQLNPKYHYVYNTSIEAIIDGYIHENHIDWLVVIPRHHSFLVGIFHRSHTKAIAHNIHIPLLALHEQ